MLKPMLAKGPDNQAKVQRLSNKKGLQLQLLDIHRGDRIRTYGIRLPKTALYQAELRPVGLTP